MGKTKENPRYNVMSFRASDEERAVILGALGACETVGDFIRDAALDCAEARFDNLDKQLRGPNA